jgi:hypothetical protein
MTYQELIEGYKKLVHRAYTYDAYLERYLTALAHMKQITFSGGPPLPEFRNLLLLMNLLQYYCLSGDRARLRFFCQIVWSTLKINPRAWIMAMRALIGHIQFKNYIEHDLRSLVIREQDELPLAPLASSDLRVGTVLNTSS